MSIRQILLKWNVIIRAQTKFIWIFFWRRLKAPETKTMSYYVEPTNLSGVINSRGEAQSERARHADVLIQHRTAWRIPQHDSLWSPPAAGIKKKKSRQRRACALTLTSAVSPCWRFVLLSLRHWPKSLSFEVVEVISFTWSFFFPLSQVIHLSSFRENIRKGQSEPSGHPQIRLSFTKYEKIQD